LCNILNKKKLSEKGWTWKVKAHHLSTGLSKGLQLLILFTKNVELSNSSFVIFLVLDTFLNTMRSPEASKVELAYLSELADLPSEIGNHGDFQVTRRFIIVVRYLNNVAWIHGRLVGSLLLL
jgi:hypothetical protein